MIEQTELVVNEWVYTPPIDLVDSAGKLISELSFDVMGRKAPTKKGIACKFTCSFAVGNNVILLYEAEDSYVIDLEDFIDENELLTMIRNTYSKFKLEFDVRKLETVLHDRSLIPLDETRIDLKVILPLLY